MISQPACSISLNIFKLSESNSTPDLDCLRSFEVGWYNCPVHFEAAFCDESVEVRLHLSDPGESASFHEDWAQREVVLLPASDSSCDFEMIHMAYKFDRRQRKRVPNLKVVKTPSFSSKSICHDTIRM